MKLPLSRLCMYYDMAYMLRQHGYKTTQPLLSGPEFKVDQARLASADLSKPITIQPSSLFPGHYVILDGRHRVMQALLNNIYCLEARLGVVSPS